MKKTIRNLATLLLAGMILFSVVACTGGSESTDGTTTPAETETGESAETDAEGKITIKYWTTNRHDQAYITPWIEEYNETNEDNVFVDFQVYADNYSQMVDLAFGTGEAPDVYQLVGDLMVAYEKEQVLDLTPYIDDDYLARFGEGVFMNGVNMVDDRIYSLPYTASASRLFYNKGIFERVGLDGPPETVQEMADYAKLISDELSSEGIYGFSGNFKSPASAVTRSIDMINMKSGGTRQGFDFKTGTYDFSSYKPVLEAYTEIFTSNAAFPGSESLDIDPLRTQFAEGNLGMYISVSHAEPGVYANQFPTEEDWGVAQLPTIDGEVKGKQALWFGGAAIGINPYTEHPDEAWNFMEFMHSDEVMGPYYSEDLGIVMIESAIEGVEPPPAIAAMPDLALNENDANWPALPVNLILEGQDYSALFVECIFGVADIDETIADLNERYNAAYDKKLQEDGSERYAYPNFDPMTLDTSE